jgi:hypothetical protein
LLAARRRLGQAPGFFIPNIAADWIYPSPTSPTVPAPSAPSAPSAPASAGFIPGSSVADYLYNAETGNLTQNQVQAIAAQNTQSYIQAGADPNTASAQASADVNAALSTFSAPGAFGVQWTGALPTSSSWYSPANWFANADGSINWLLIGGIAVSVVALTLLLRK